MYSSTQPTQIPAGQLQIDHVLEIAGQLYQVNLITREGESGLIRVALQMISTRRVKIDRPVPRSLNVQLIIHENFPVTLDE